MDSKTLTTLVAVFAPLSLVAIGGGGGVSAEIQRQAVEVHGWLTQSEFQALFAISRAAPGPGALLAVLVGWHVAGWLGALAVSLAFFLPSSMLVYAVGHLWNRWRDAPWHSAVAAGFTPIAAGLVLASGVAILHSGGNALLAWITAGGLAAARLIFSNIHPLIWIALGMILFVCARTFA